MGESEPYDDEYGPQIRWVTDVCVWAGSDQFMFRMHGKVERKELAKLMETTDANA